MCKTTTPPRPAPQDAIRKLPPNTNAGAVTPLQSYLEKYWNQFKNHLVPTTPPSLPPDVDPNAYKRVAFSVWPLLSDATSPYYAGKFDDDTDFSASLVKVAALFAAGQLLAEAKVTLARAVDELTFFNSLDDTLQAEINANADPRILHAHPTLPSRLMPDTKNVVKVTGFGSGSGPTVSFTNTTSTGFNNNLSLMIVQSDDPASGVCIDRLGFGYISAVLNQKNFFDSTLPAGPDLTARTGRGIWLTSDYAHHTIARIPCVNDHNDAQLTTARQMCTLFCKIRLKQLPETDLDTNTLMQSLLNEPKTGPHHTTPWLSPSRSPGVAPLFTILQDKIGFAGLGFTLTPNVYSEGLIIKWDNSSQVDSFNNKIDPTNANPNIRLSGEIAVCWQNLLADNLPGGGFDGVIEVLNKTIEDFLKQSPL
jgi:Beta-lactamase enzyme family